MPDFSVVTTPRLELRAIEQADMDGLFAIMNDPAQWRHAPRSRHLDRETTVAWIERAIQRWESHRLSYWTVRHAGADAIVGVGGAQRQVTGAWNLNWRIATTHQRQGLATGLGREALKAAAQVDASVPVIAWIRDGNRASIAVAERLQLSGQGLHPDPADGAERLAFADRPLTAAYFA